MELLQRDVGRSLDPKKQEVDQTRKWRFRTSLVHFAGLKAETEADTDADADSDADADADAEAWLSLAKSSERVGRKKKLPPKLFPSVAGGVSSRVIFHHHCDTKILDAKL